VFFHNCGKSRDFLRTISGLSKKGRNATGKSGKIDLKIRRNYRKYGGNFYSADDHNLGEGENHLKRRPTMSAFPCRDAALTLRQFVI